MAECEKGIFAKLQWLSDPGKLSYIFNTTAGGQNVTSHPHTRN